MHEQQIDPIVELMMVLSIMLGRLNVGLSATTDLYLMASQIKLHFNESQPYLVFTTPTGKIIKVEASILDQQPSVIAFSLPLVFGLFPEIGNN